MLISWSKNYKNLAVFFGLEKTIKTLSYSDLIGKFQQMLMPQKSAVVSQYYFFGVFQKEKQSVSSYVTALLRDLSECKLSTKCKCGKNISLAGTFLR